MIDTQAIRNRILQLALQGQLVEQDATDTPASELVMKLSEKITGKASCSHIKEEEIPYSVPQTWVWCRLSDIGTTNIGLTYHPEDTSTSGTIVARSSNIVNGKMDYSDLVRVTCPIRDNQYLGTNDILICARNGSKALVGKCAIFEGKPSTVAFGAFMAVFRTPLYRYVYYYFNTTVFKRNFAGDDSKQINQVTQKILKESLIPIPPLEEQQRIVDKIDNAFSVLEAIDTLQTQYTDNLTTLKAKLIDAAIQGKLTEQLPEDGTAEELYQQIQTEKQALIKAGKIKKEKPLPEITADEISIEIPENWKSCRLGTIITLVSGTDYKPEEYNAEMRGTPYITGASNLLPEGVLINRWTETPRCIANDGDVLLVCKGSGYGKVAMCDVEEAHIARQIMAIKKTDLLDMRYILYYLTANFSYLKGKGQGLIPGVDRKSVLGMIFPLPPLAEQKRIAQKIDELLPLFEK